MNLSNLPDAKALLSEHIMPFIGDESFLFIAGVCRLFRDTHNSYSQQHEQTQTSSTSLKEIVSSVSRVQMVMHELNTDVRQLNDDILSRSIIECAVYNGNLDVLIWIKNNNAHRWEMVCQRVRLCFIAANGGKLKILQWLRSKDGGNCRWDKQTCQYAAHAGHFELLKWAHQNGCPWDEFTCAYAALKGHLEILKWARENGCPWSRITCSNAANKGLLNNQERATTTTTTTTEGFTALSSLVEVSGAIHDSVGRFSPPEGSPASSSSSSLVEVSDVIHASAGHFSPSDINNLRVDSVTRGDGSSSKTATMHHTIVDAGASDVLVETLPADSDGGFSPSGIINHEAVVAAINDDDGLLSFTGTDGSDVSAQRKLIKSSKKVRHPEALCTLSLFADSLFMYANQCFTDIMVTISPCDDKDDT
jgi:hypothetical protein